MKVPDFREYNFQELKSKFKSLENKSSDTKKKEGTGTLKSKEKARTVVPKKESAQQK